MPYAPRAELVLGSVQLGLSYGAANRTGKPSRAAALALVRHAVSAGVTVFDTARAYGDSENLLGEALQGCAVRTVTKLSPLSDLAASSTLAHVRAAVDGSIAESMAALRHGRLDCVLVHRAEHLTSFKGAIWERLNQLQSDGTICSLGVSVQSPAEASAALQHMDVRHIQLPFNLLDRRWRESGVIDRIRERPDVTIHVRSVFLQGLLATGDPAIWPPVVGVNAMAIIDSIRTLSNEFGRESKADLCLAYVRGQDWIDGVVVGMETEEQLRENLRLFDREPLSREACEAVSQRIPRAPAELLNPALWPKRECRDAA